MGRDLDTFVAPRRLDALGHQVMSLHEFRRLASINPSDRETILAIADEATPAGWVLVLWGVEGGGRYGGANYWLLDARPVSADWCCPESPRFEVVRVRGNGETMLSIRCDADGSLTPRLTEAQVLQEIHLLYSSPTTRSVLVRMADDPAQDVLRPPGGRLAVAERGI